MSAMASQITSVSILYSTVCLGTNCQYRRKCFHLMTSSCSLKVRFGCNHLEGDHLIVSMSEKQSWRYSSISHEVAEQLKTKLTHPVKILLWNTVNLAYAKLERNGRNNLKYFDIFLSRHLLSPQCKTSQRWINTRRLARHQISAALFMSCDRYLYRCTNRSPVNWHYTQIASFMRPTWGPPGSCRPQLGPMLAPWTVRATIFHHILLLLLLLITSTITITMDHHHGYFCIIFVSFPCLQNMGHMSNTFLMRLWYDALITNILTNTK